MSRLYTLFFIIIVFISACNKSGEGSGSTSPAPPLAITSISIQDNVFNNGIVNQSTRPVIKLLFSEPVNSASVAASISLKDALGSVVPIQATVNLSEIIVTPTNQLSYLSQYYFEINTTLKSAAAGSLQSTIKNSFVTAIDSTRKFLALSNDALLDKVQQQTLKYFWDFAHPVSGMIREGSKHPPDIVTSGGTGFGIMALLVAAERNFVPKTEVLSRISKIVLFLKDIAQTFHGAYPHWLNGANGVTIPFSNNDDGADLVETSFLVQGLLCARQYFGGASADEVALRNHINTIIDRVEWNWFTNDNQNVLYWHWSANKGWAMNLKIQGWNECLITYVLAAASKNYSIPTAAYNQGWAQSGALKNTISSYGGYTIPLGAPSGGPLFFEHYSFMGINPNGLSDAYANYQTQTKNHTLVNYEYCKLNPKSYYGYSDSVWGLTASNIKNGYEASSPSNDLGFIAPTAAISSLPYTPEQSMAALKFFYYVLGDQIFKEYGFVDAFSLDVVKNNGAWFADSFLAINQGPIVVMIENYRSQLLWNLFMSCPEVKAGLIKLGFSSPAI